jgi:putative hydrolase of the HAD superfamily
MLEAIARCHERLKTALITNNIATTADSNDAMLSIVEGLFDVVVESSKTGLRKPDPRIYELTCEQLDVDPSEVVFLDDLGINLKPAAQMGMTTIKVVDPDVALAELESVVGFSVR